MIGRLEKRRFFMKKGIALHIISLIVVFLLSACQSSINDVPNVEGYIVINLNCSGGSIKTVFFYEKNGKEIA